MTADKVRNMLLEEERRIKTIILMEPLLEAFSATRNRVLSRKALEGFNLCPKCGKPYRKEECWKLYPELAPEWLQEKWTIEKKSRKRRMNQEDQDREGYMLEFNSEEEAEKW